MLLRGRINKFADPNYLRPMGNKNLIHTAGVAHLEATDISCETVAVSSRSWKKPRQPLAPYRVVVHGLPYFCQKLPDLLQNDNWDVRYHSQQNPLGLAALASDLRRCNLAYTWGGRISMGKFLWAARTLGKTKIVILWCGSDVLVAREELAAGKSDPWVADRTHWAVSPTLAEEVRSLGLRCEYVQASFVSPVKSPKPLPAKFSVLVFLPTVERTELYGWDRVVKVAQAMPAVEFKVVGLHDDDLPPAPPNVIVHRWTEDLTPFYEQTTVLWRPVRHDAGISFMVLEALAHGRHVLYTYAIPGCVQVSGAIDAQKQLQNLVSLHRTAKLQLNYEGIRIVGQRYSREAVRSELHKRWEEIILS